MSTYILIYTSPSPAGTISPAVSGGDINILIYIDTVLSHHIASLSTPPFFLNSILFPLLLKLCIIDPYLLHFSKTGCKA